MIGSLGGWGELLLKVQVWLPAIELATSCYCLWRQNILGCMNRAWKAGCQIHIRCKKTARIFCFRDNCGLYCNACNPEFLAVCPSIHLLGLKLSQIVLWFTLWTQSCLRRQNQTWVRYLSRCQTNIEAPKTYCWKWIDSCFLCLPLSLSYLNKHFHCEIFWGKKPV